MCKRTCDISRIVSQEAAALELWNVRNKRCLIRAKWNTIAARLRSEKNRLMLLRLLPITPPPQAHVYHEVCSHRLARSFAPLLLSTSSHLPLSLSLVLWLTHPVLDRSTCWAPSRNFAFLRCRRRYDIHFSPSISTSIPIPMRIAVKLRPRNPKFWNSSIFFFVPT